MSDKNIAKESFNAVKAELENKGTLAGVIERNHIGEWMGMIYEKDMSFVDPGDQIHFAKCVFNGQHLS